MHEADFVERFEQFWVVWPKDRIIEGPNFFALATVVGSLWFFIKVVFDPDHGIKVFDCAIDPSQRIVVDRLLMAECGCETSPHCLFVPLKEMQSTAKHGEADPRQVCFEAMQELQREIEVSPGGVLSMIRCGSEAVAGHIQCSLEEFCGELRDAERAQLG